MGWPGRDGDWWPVARRVLTISGGLLFLGAEKYTTHGCVSAGLGIVGLASGKRQPESRRLTLRK